MNFSDIHFALSQSRQYASNSLCLIYVKSLVIDTSYSWRDVTITPLLSDTQMCRLVTTQCPVPTLVSGKKWSSGIRT